jgi:uncharacterized SAM-binding protein YcdF (DUF218 family)
MMFLAKKLVTPFLLPPGIFIAILVAVVIRLVFRKQWRGAFWLMILTISMWLFSIPPTSHFFLRHLESRIETPDVLRGDVIILLGGGIYDQMPDLSGMGAPPESYLARITEAYRLYRKLRLPILTCGGTAPWQQISEASVSARFLMDLGVPRNQLILEDRSRDTYENALYAKTILDRWNFHNPILVTSGYHMPRAMLAFEKVGVAVSAFPAGRRTWTGMTYSWRDYLPSGYSELALALKEYLGLMYYRVTDRP